LGRDLEWHQQREMRGRLWNAIEEKERRKDSQLAREMVASIPRELSHCLRCLHTIERAEGCSEA
jgi:hypothetical protein